jgi:integrase
MENLVVLNQDCDNVISFEIVKEKQKEVKYNKDGSANKSKNRKEKGVSSEVYAFRTNEEIKNIVKVLNKHISKATDQDKLWIAYRNKLMFLIGWNVGIRASDLRTLRWNFFFEYNEDKQLEFKKFYTLQPMKQRKQKKFIKLFFNNTVKKAINEHIKMYPIEDLNDYLFSSRKGEDAITAKSICRIVKDIAEEAGVKQNIGSHSLRKTWGYNIWHEAEDKNRALVMLQECFAHSSTQVTMRYIGLLDEEKCDMYNSVNIGFEFI